MAAVSLHSGDDSQLPPSSPGVSSKSVGISAMGQTANKQSKNQRESSLSYSPPDSNPPALKAKCSGGSSSWCGISRLWNPVCGMNSLLLGKKSLQLWLSSHLWVNTCDVGLDYTSSPALLLDSYSFLVSLVVKYIFCLSTGCSLW